MIHLFFYENSVFSMNCYWYIKIDIWPMKYLWFQKIKLSQIYCIFRHQTQPHWGHPEPVGGEEQGDHRHPGTPQHTERDGTVWRRPPPRTRFTIELIVIELFQVAPQQDERSHTNSFWRKTFNFLWLFRNELYIFIESDLISEVSFLPSKIKI